MLAWQELCWPQGCQHGSASIIPEELCWRDCPLGSYWAILVPIGPLGYQFGAIFDHLGGPFGLFNGLIPFIQHANGIYSTATWPGRPGMPPPK